jgi:hypothetical protein
VLAGDDAGAPTFIAAADEKDFINVIQLVYHDGEGGNLRKGESVS